MLNYPYLSPQELKEKTIINQKTIEEVLDIGKEFHPDLASIYTNLKPEDTQLVKETIRAIPLKEFLSRGQTLGNYLVAAKVNDELIFGSRLGDRVPYISAQVITGWSGADLDITVSGVGDTGWSFTPDVGVSGGIAATNTGNVTKATISPIFFNTNIRISNDMLDDAAANADLLTYHIRAAGQEMGMYGTRMAVKVLAANTDGLGTANTQAGDAGETKFGGSATKDVLAAFGLCKQDGFHATSVLTNYESARHSILAYSGATFMPAKEGYDFWLNGFDIAVHPYHLDLTDTRLTTLVFDRNNALITGRKRWLQIENYSDPIRDLAGAIVTARQDSVTLFKEATCKIEEAA